MKRSFAALSLALGALMSILPVPAYAGISASAIANNALAVATSTGTVGLCYRGVKKALKPIGVKLEGGSAYMARSQLLKDKRFKVVSKTKLQKNDGRLQKGDIIVHGKSKKHPNGHIAVYLGNNKEASDHIQKLVVGRSYSSTIVFRAKNSAGKMVLAKAAPRNVKSKAIIAKVAPQKAKAKTLIAKARPVGAAHRRPATSHSEALSHAISVAKPKVNWPTLSNSRLPVLPPASAISLSRALQTKPPVPVAPKSHDALSFGTVPSNDT